MTDVFSGPPDPQDVSVRLRGIEDRGEVWVLRVHVGDGTGAEAREVEIFVSGSTASTHRLEPDGVEALTYYINGVFPREHRLAFFLGWLDAGGEYWLAGSEAGLYVRRPPLRVAA